MGGPVQTAEEDIIRSWHVNAKPWTEVIRGHGIASRRLVTDAAIVDAVCSVSPRRVLDIGCGEGWLARALQHKGVTVLGIDAVPALVAEATRQGGGEFAVHTYHDIVAGELDLTSFDAAVCNFSLLGDESVESMLSTIGASLGEPGHVIVQTLHPVTACGDQSYQDGWHPGSWSGFGPEFSDPAPWFFRTVAGWYAMLRRCRLDVTELREPTGRGSSVPSSIIFMCTRSGAAPPA